MTLGNSNQHILGKIKVFFLLCIYFAFTSPLQFCALNLVERDRKWHHDDVWNMCDMIYICFLTRTVSYYVYATIEVAIIDKKDWLVRIL